MLVLVGRPCAYSKVFGLLGTQGSSHAVVWGHWPPSGDMVSEVAHCNRMPDEDQNCPVREGGAVTHARGWQWALPRQSQRDPSLQRNKPIPHIARLTDAARASTCLFGVVPGARGLGIHWQLH